jgi:hypothetical protein
MIYKDISHVNWSVLNTPQDELDSLGIAGSFLVPQLLAFVASQLPLATTAEGKIKFEESVLLWIQQAKAGEVKFNNRAATVAELRGILSYLCAVPRGDVLGVKQIDPKFVRYATGVPLILSAYREYKDIPYSRWDWSEPVSGYTNYVLDHDMLELVPYILDHKAIDWTAETLVLYRDTAATVKSGANQGKTKPLNQVTSITGVDVPEFRALPKLLKLMLCQTWVFQPHIASKFAITNISDIDTPAEPISDLELFDVPKTKVAPLNRASEIPWD